MTWTLLTLLAVGWLLAMLAGVGPPWSWIPPAGIVLLLLLRLLAGLRR
jgi:hypothetical protein